MKDIIYSKIDHGVSCLVEMDIRNIQEKIEKDIFDEHNRVLENFHSLISLIFTSAGFSFTLINF